jgi:hypothetical protein
VAGTVYSLRPIKNRNLPCQVQSWDCVFFFGRSTQFSNEDNGSDDDAATENQRPHGGKGLATKISLRQVSEKRCAIALHLGIRRRRCPIKRAKEDSLTGKIQETEKERKKMSKTRKITKGLNPYFKWWERFVLSPMNPKGKLLSEGRFTFF